MSKFRPSVSFVVILGVLAMMPYLAISFFGDSWATKQNIALVKKVIPAAQASMPNMDVPDAVDLSFYLDENKIELAKVGGHEPVILAAQFSAGQLDPVQMMEHKAGDLILYSDGRVAKLWYFDQDNTMVQVSLPGYMACNNSN